MRRGQTWLDDGWWIEAVKCWVTSRNLIVTDKLGLLFTAEEAEQSVGGNRQAGADKDLDLIQTISRCLLQEASSDRSKRPQGCIGGSGGCLAVSVVHSHPRRPLPPFLSISLAVNDLRRTLTRSLGPCSLLANVSHHLASLFLHLYGGMNACEVT